jgi:hypothetical protein
MEVVDINLAGISFKASTEWMFFPYEHFILARRDSKKGILKISLAEQTNGHAVTPSDLLRAAQKFISRGKLPAPFDVKEPYPGSYLFGAASYKIREKDRDYMTRVYYFSRGNDLLFATYGCPWDFREDEQVREEMSQCEKMILSVKFAKPH